MPTSAASRKPARHGGHPVALYWVVGQAAWLAAVHGGAHADPVPGWLCAAGMASWHLSRAARPSVEASSILAVTLVGWCWDSVLAGTGWLVYPGQPAGSLGAPAWIAALWAIFAIQLNVVFVRLRGRPWLAAMLGAVAGPLSFRAGAALGAVSFAPPAAAFAALAAGWAVLLPAAVQVARYLDGMAPLPRQAGEQQ
ncbi:hypothetical protein WJ59_09390 [Burkholderia gladioli]|uniref:DUF2878 domain-containing protein n=1 Tax=Burkholderia gladioli TaxID=28095 RepID=UPI0006894FFD|nr:DUF2878 domain-containing protein [Burkholderia gladioli]KVM70745.1 hypothetical protein WJ59_09390 [Burkholderia gladioli]